MRPEDFAFPVGVFAPAYARHRRDCRMMVVNRETGRIEHRAMADLEQYVGGDELWANDSFDISKPDQTYHPVYAAHPGSHASPTAGLFITNEQVEKLNIHLLTLHISGPRGQEDINAGYRSNVGWREWYTIPALPASGVTAIGTTVVKALETWARTGQKGGWSTLFVQPPFSFQVVKRLLTNFHFAKEPLLAMVSAFGGCDLIREAYAAAVDQRYLFGDYGDRLLVI